MYVRRTAHIALFATAALIVTAPLDAQSAPVHAQTAPVHSRSAPLHAQSTPLHAQSAPVHAWSALHGRAPWLAPRPPVTSWENASAVGSVGSGGGTALQDGGGWSSLRIAKWTTAALSAGAAVYGVVNNRRADDEFEQLEQVCIDQPARCTDRLPDGAYADPDMEAQYQSVRALDRRARTALIAGQIGIAASVVLFVLDLRNDDGPGNIPYDPDTLDIAPAHDGGLTLRVNLQLPRR